MKKREFYQQSEKIIRTLSEETVSTMKTLSESEESVLLDFQNIEHHEQVQLMVKEGFIAKDYRHYELTKKGTHLLEGVRLFKEEPKKFEKLLEEKNEKAIVIEYKLHDEKQNIIKNQIASFDVEKDGLPIVVVNEDAYTNLIHRSKGQHWKQYLGEDGRNLIRQKKLDRFYVEDEETKRRYLYIVPKNK